MSGAHPLVATPPENTAALTDGFQQLVQEHTQLMDRAIQEDDAVLVPLIEAFMTRCRTYQQRQEAPEQTRRLSGFLQYWEAFLKALKQSP
jgi:hypothetical protein